MSEAATVNNWVSTSSTSWNVVANWDQARVPNSTDIATFDPARSNVSCSLNTTVNVAGIDIKTGYTGTLTQNAGITITVGSSNFGQSGGTFAGGDSAITINGTFSLSVGTFTSTSGTLTVASTFTISGGTTFNHNNGSVSFTGGVATLTPLATAFKNVTFKASGDSPKTIATGSTLLVTGNLALTDGSVGSETIEIQGNLTVASGFDGCTSPVNFTGGNAQSLTLTGAEDKLDGNILINKTAGTVTLGSALTLDAVSHTLNVTSGTLAIGNNNLVLSDDTATLTIDGGTLTQGSGTITCPTFTQTGGTFGGGSGNMTVSGVFTLSGGNFTSTSGTLTASSTFTLSGTPTFAHNSGSVIFNGDDATITPSTATFNNVMFNATDASTKTITSGNTLTVSGTLRLTDGLVSSGSLEAQGDVIVASTLDSCNLPLNFTGGNAQSFDLTGAEALFNGDITVNKTTGTVVSLASDCTLDVNSQTLTITSGTFDVNGHTLSSGTNTTSAALVLTVNGGTLTNGTGTTSVRTLTVSSGTVNGGSGPITVNAGFTLSGGIFTSTSGTLTVGVNLTVSGAPTFNHNSGMVTFTTGGNATITPSTILFNDVTFNSLGTSKTLAGGSTLTVTRDLFLTDGTVNVGTLEVQRNVTVASGFDGGTTILNFTGGNTQSFNLTGGEALFNGNITVNKTSGTVVSLASDCTLDVNSQTLMITSGTFDVNGRTLSRGTNTALALTVNGGTLTNGTGTTSVQTLTVSSGTVNGGSGPITVNGAFTLSGGTFTCTSGTLTASSTFTVSGAPIFNHNSGMVSFFNGGNVTITPSTLLFNDVTFNSPGITKSLASGSTLTVTRDLFLTDGTVNVGILEVQRNVTVASGFDGGTALLNFTGGNAQSFDLTGAEALFDGNITVNKTSGSVVSLASDCTLNVNSQTLMITSGTLNVNGRTLSRGTNTALALTVNGGTLTNGTGTTSVQTLTVSSGSVNGGSGPITVNGAFTLSGGTFTSTSGTLTASSTFTVSGAPIFNHNSGMVSFFNGGNVTITPSTLLFNDVTFNCPGATKTIASGSTLTVTRDLFLTDGVVSTGTLEVQRNVTVASGFDAGSAFLNFTGGNDQTYTDNNAGTVPTSNVTINKTVGSKVTLATAASFNANGQTLTLTSGTLSLAGFNLTVKVATTGLTVGANGTLQLQGGETITVNAVANNPITLNAGSTVTYLGNGNGATDTFILKNYTYQNLIVNSATGNADTFNLPAALTVAQNFTLSAGSVDATGSNFALTISGNWSQSGGTYTAQAGIITVGGNWTHSAGTFTRGTSTLVFNNNSLGSTISGDTIFTNLTCTTAGKTLTFANGSTQTIMGTLQLHGSSGSLLVLRSSSSGSAWIIDPQGATRSVSHVDVMDSNNINATAIAAGATSTNSTGNTNWTFASGTDTFTWTNGSADGKWSTNGNWQGGAAPGASDVAIFNGTNTSNCSVDVTITVGGIDIQSGYTGTITPATVTVNLGGSGYKQAAGTFTDGARPINVTGNWSKTGGTFTTTGTVTFNSAVGTQTFDSGGSTFAAITHSAASTLKLTGNLTGVTGTVTNSAGILDLNGMNFGYNSARAVANSAGATIRLQGGESFTNVNNLGTGSGTVEYLGNGDGSINTFTMKDFGATDYFNLLINDTNATKDIFQMPTGGNTLTVAGTFMVTSGTYDANAQATTVTGLTTVNGGTYLQSGGGTQTYTAGLTVSSGTYTGSSGTITMNGTFNMNSGTFTGGTGPIAMNSAFNMNSGLFTAGAQTITAKAAWTYLAGTLDLTTNGSTVVFAATLTATGSHTFQNLTFDPNAAGTTTITIASGTTLTVNGTLTFDNSSTGAVTINTGTIAAKGAITVADAIDYGGTAALLINGNTNQTFSGSATQTVGGILAVNIDKSGGGTLFLAGTLRTNRNWTYTAGTVDAVTNDNLLVIVPASTTFTGSHTLNRVTIDSNSASTATLTIASGTTLTATGTLTFDNTSTGATTINTGTIAAKGAITVADSIDYGGTAALLINGNTNQTFSGSATQTAGGIPILNIDKSGGGTLFLAGTLRTNRSWTYTAGTVDAVTNNNLLVIVPTANAGQPTFTGSHTLNRVTIDGNTSTGTTLTFAIASGTTLTAAGTLTFDNTLTAPISISTGTLAAQGNITVADNDNYSIGTSTLLINGSGNQTFTGSAGQTIGLIPNVEINKNGGTLFLAGTLRTNRNWTYTAGTVDAVFNDNLLVIVPSTSLPTFTGSHTLNRVTIDGNNSTATTLTLTIASGTTLTVAGTLTFDNTLTGPIAINTGTLAAQGNITVADTDNYGVGTGTLLINGSGNQTFTGSATQTAGFIPNVEINKNGGTLFLGGTLRTNRNWTYTAGTVDAVTNNNLMVIVPTTSLPTFTGSHTLNRVTIDGNNATGTTLTLTITSGTTLTVTGTLTFDNTLTAPIAINTGTLAAQGNITVADTDNYGVGTGTLLINGSGNQTFTGSATQTVGGIPKVEINKNSGTLFLAGTLRTNQNWTYTAGTVDAVTNNNLMVIVPTANAGQPTYTGSHTLNSVTIDSNSTISTARTLTIASGTTLTVSGTLTFDNTLTSPTSISTGILAAQGNITVADNLNYGGGTGTLLINGAGNQTFTGSADQTNGFIPNFRTPDIHPLQNVRFLPFKSLSGHYRTGVIGNQEK